MANPDDGGLARDVDEELAQLRARVRRLAEEKSHLALLVQLMTNMSSVAGFRDTVVNILQCFIEGIGGSDAVLYYWVQGQLRRTSLLDGTSDLEAPDQPIVQDAIARGEPVSREHDFHDTRLQTPSFVSAYDWACPLKVGSRLVGVVWLAGLHADMGLLQGRARPLLSFAALLLDRELRGQAQLEAAFAELQRAHGNLDRILGAIRDAVIVTTAERLVFSNGAWQSLRVHLGGDAPAAELPLVALERVLDAGHHTRLVAAHFAALESRTALGPLELELRKAEWGEVTHLEVSMLPLQFDDAPAVVTILRDISSVRQADLRAREMERMSSIGTLSAGIAHEINTPMQFMGDSAAFLRDAVSTLGRALGRYRALAQGLADLGVGGEALRDVEAQDEAEDTGYFEAESLGAVERVALGVARVSRIVAAMKEFGRPMAEAPEPVALNELVQNALIVAEHEVAPVAEVTLDLGELPLVVCYPAALNQVLLNLIVNAAHAVGDRVRGTAEKGRVAVRTTQEGGLIHVTVSDTGAGIPASIQHRIFDPFFTTKEVGKGTGQGLAIARAVILERHGGRIWFETAEGVGTQFHFVLPIDASLRLTTADVHRRLRHPVAPT